MRNKIGGPLKSEKDIKYESKKTDELIIGFVNLYVILFLNKTKCCCSSIVGQIHKVTAGR